MNQHAQGREPGGGSCNYAYPGLKDLTLGTAKNAICRQARSPGKSSRCRRGVRPDGVAAAEEIIRIVGGREVAGDHDPPYGAERPRGAGHCGFRLCARNRRHQAIVAGLELLENDVVRAAYLGM